MLKLTVSQDGSGDFSSISEALLAVPYELEAEICIGPGIYREKLVCEKRVLTLRGAGADATTLIFGDGGKLPHPDGRPTHTFRSYTAFFSGGSVTVEDLTIANDAGPGSAVGQAIAAYVDAEKAVFRRVRLLGNQDTLFCAPLPEAEREKDGFLGPRKFAPRRPSAQYYQSCEIAGDIDFIFGGADALFEQCILRTVDNHLPHSYITAPSGSANGLGFVFWDCDFVSDCPAGTVYLGRPWRPTGKTAVLDCRLGAHIAPEGFSGWNDRTDTCLARFAEAGSSGPGARQRPDWVAAPSAAAAAQGAEPEPASLENKPRLIPFIKTAPKPPPATCFSPNASLNILSNTPGIKLIFLTIINIVTRKYTTAIIGTIISSTLTVAFFLSTITAAIITSTTVV